MIIRDLSVPSPKYFRKLIGSPPRRMHFLRNALDYLPRKVADECLIELRWLYDRRNADEAA